MPSLPVDGQRLSSPQSTDSAEQLFLESWREELTRRTWEALEELEQQTNQPCYTVLRFRVDHPLASSAEMAEQIGQRLGKPFTIHGVRQALHRAREKFADLFVAEVARTLKAPNEEALTQELCDLGLLSHCRAALQRRRPNLAA